MARIVPRFGKLRLADPYADVEINARLNPPMATFEEFGTGEVLKVRAALASIVRDSNLEDDKGDPIDLTTVEGWRSVPPDLMEAAADALLEAIHPKAKGTERPGSEPSSSPGEATPPATTAR